MPDEKKKRYPARGHIIKWCCRDVQVLHRCCLGSSGLLPGRGIRDFSIKISIPAFSIWKQTTTRTQPFKDLKKIRPPGIQANSTIDTTVMTQTCYSFQMCVCSHYNYHRSDSVSSSSRLVGIKCYRPSPIQVSPLQYNVIHFIISSIITFELHHVLRGLSGVQMTNCFML